MCIIEPGLANTIEVIEPGLAALSAGAEAEGVHDSVHTFTAGAGALPEALAGTRFSNAFDLLMNMPPWGAARPKGTARRRGLVMERLGRSARLDGSAKCTIECLTGMFMLS